jgi:hypothetical protein
MKRTRILWGVSLAFLLCLETFFGLAPAAVAGNRCKDRCNQVYRLRKDACRAIPLKHERHSCEKAAKRAKDDCKHRCR